MNKAHFPHVFSDIQVGKFPMQNRIKYAACCVSNFNTREGFLSDREYARDQVIASTGAAMMTNQGAYPDPGGEGKAYHRQLALYDDRFIPGVSRIADLFHDNQAIAIQQVLHGGRYGGIDLDYCLQASDTAQTLRHFRPPREMTKDQIAQSIEEHARAAERCIKAGFDGVEVTSFLGYLMSTFLSPFTNKRTDEYGGTHEKRARFMIEIIQALRKAVGPDKLVIIRLNGTELMGEFGGATEDECIENMRIAADLGVDMISMVIGWHESRKGALGRDVGRTQWLYLAERAKKVIGDVPLAFGPRLADPWEAEMALANGAFDVWEVCRPFLTDPQLAHKMNQGKPETIKPCIGCMLCLAKMFANQPYICAVNPRLGHEVEPEYSTAPAAVRKKVMVIGGGPAGLEAAIAAAERGHEVALYEARERLGGALWPSSRDIGGGEVLLELLRFYELRLKELGITVNLNTPVDRKVTVQYFPDVVIVATGAKTADPAFSLADGVELLSAENLLAQEQYDQVGERVVIIGGGKVGLTLAEVLATGGKKPVILEANRRVDFDVSPTFKWRHAGLVKELGIDVVSEAEVLAVEKGQVRFRGQDGEDARPADSVVLAGPRLSNQNLFTDLEYFCDELYVVGDALLPRSLYNAIHEGFKIGVRV